MNLENQITGINNKSFYIRALSDYFEILDTIDRLNEVLVNKTSRLGK